jgi:hypothetical protein
MADWKALTARITFVASAPTQPPSDILLDLYKQLWSSSPRNFQDSGNPMLPATATGIIKGMSATCSTLPNRVDITFGPDTNKPGAEPSKLTLMEDSAALKDELERIAQEIGAGSIHMPSGFDRPAVFLQLLSVADTVIDANKIVASKLPSRFNVKLSDEYGFALQAGRKLPALDGNKASINALTRWSTEQFHVFSFAMNNMPVGATTNLPIQQQITSHFGASVSMDCTAESEKALNSREQSDLLLNGLAIFANTLRECGISVVGFSDVRNLN